MTAPLEALLDELTAVLEHERVALTRLDREGIEAAADRKLELDAQLKAVELTSAPPSGAIARLKQIQTYALQNQRLLAHARACVQGVLQLISGTPAIGHPSLPPRVAPSPVALNIRG